MPHLLWLGALVLVVVAGTDSEYCDASPRPELDGGPFANRLPFNETPLAPWIWRLLALGVGIAVVLAVVEARQASRGWRARTVIHLVGVGIGAMIVVFGALEQIDQPRFCSSSATIAGTATLVALLAFVMVVTVAAGRVAPAADLPA